MRAWILRGQAPMTEGPLELVELPKPEPRPGEARIRVRVCGICRTDLHVAEGDLPAGKEKLVLGHEIVGVVDALGEGVTGLSVGQRVGVTWLGRSCGECQECRSGRENYCRRFLATGMDLDGGFAEYTVAHKDAVYSLEGIPLPEEELAPLLCPGVAGFCSLRLLELGASSTIALYGFGPTAFYVLKTARGMGMRVLVSTRSDGNRERALRNGADWVGDAGREPLPEPVDGAIVFPPAGPLVEQALRTVRVGGVLVLAPVAMSTIQIGDYSSHLWGRDIRTLYNVNRRDSEAFLKLAREADLSLSTEVVAFEELEDAMIRVKEGRIDKANAAVRVQ